MVDDWIVVANRAGARLFTPAALLARSLGIRAGWRSIQGSSDFVEGTKKIHDALQRAEIGLTDSKKRFMKSSSCKTQCV